MPTREYQPGDDIALHHWNVTANAWIFPHVRQYIEDREISAWFLLDLQSIHGLWRRR
ncbi:MAG: DUF58 domain-containing protein [Caldilineaceae bacterium]